MGSSLLVWNWLGEQLGNRSGLLVSVQLGNWGHMVLRIGCCSECKF
jgi:hypothetical protein